MISDVVHDAKHYFLKDHQRHDDIEPGALLEPIRIRCFFPSNRASNLQILYSMAHRAECVEPLSTHNDTGLFNELFGSFLYSSFRHFLLQSLNVFPRLHSVICDRTSSHNEATPLLLALLGLILFSLANQSMGQPLARRIPERLVFLPLLRRLLCVYLDSFLTFHKLVLEIFHVCRLLPLRGGNIFQFRDCLEKLAVMLRVGNDRLFRVHLRAHDSPDSYFYQWGLRKVICTPCWVPQQEV